jgi:hypothetical protein
MAITIPSGKPSHVHDCEACFYVGKDNPRSKEEGNNYVDLYYHPGWRIGSGALVRRWESGPKGLCTMLMSSYMKSSSTPEPKWSIIVNAAKKHGHQL